VGITHKSKTRRDLTSGPKGPATTAWGKRCLPKAGEASPRDSDAVYASSSVGAREDTLALRAMRAFVFDHSHSRAPSELSTNDAPATRGDARSSTALRASLAPGCHSRARWARCQVPSTCLPWACLVRPIRDRGRRASFWCQEPPFVPGLIAVLVLSEAVLACLAVASFPEARARNRSFRCRDLLFDYELPSTSTISRGARCSI